MSIESDHINYLIYRYLLESGFQHSSFTFGEESGVLRHSVSSTPIPRGSLIAHLQRALNYVQAEVNLTDDGRPADLDDLETIDALDLIESVQPKVCEKRRQQLRDRLREKARSSTETAATDSAAAAGGSTVEFTKTKPEDVTLLEGHDEELFNCAWNPVKNTVASGSCDKTARIWNLDEPTSHPLVLFHGYSHKEREVTCLEWSPDGELLATGFVDSVARVWNSQGDLHHRLKMHEQALFSVSWSPNGRMIATASVDTTAIVWDAVKGDPLHRFKAHQNPCVDIAWQSNNLFATCSTDTTIAIMNVAEKEVVRHLTGHENDVNQIKWDPTSKVLASCSDDCTVKLWTLDSPECTHTLAHNGKPYAVSWNPRKPEAAGGRQLLASACSAQIKIWNGLDGQCLYTLQAHSDEVFTLSFSPNGMYLASGSADQRVLVWDIETGTVIQLYESDGVINQVCWDMKGTRIAAASGKVLSIIKCAAAESAEAKSN
eukprot:m.360814 g.360814  ORF g.360814 m.360814 type:complete len:488 (-) comp19173_c0_seq1:455-1918(-)